jgi:N-acetyl-anhydromuramyl-L-alanine amidase AmpD
MEFPFIQARWCGPSREGERILLIVIHTMEAPEKPHTAKNVAMWFASVAAPKASTHYCVDDVDIIGCVRENVVAWGAPSANRAGIHIEHAGYASQSAVNWADEYSEKMLTRSAALVSDIAKRHGIPIRKLSADDLIDPAATGICGHVDVTYGRNEGHGHTDPGQFFPWEHFLKMVEVAMADTDPNSPEPGDVA